MLESGLEKKDFMSGRGKRGREDKMSKSMHTVAESENRDALNLSRL